MCIGGIIGHSNGVEIKKCYNIGALEGTTLGKIIGIIRDGTIENCYFLGIASDNAVGENPNSITVNATPKTESEMKTQEFVDLLNAGQTPAPWKYVQNSYPILSWQK